ncbi:MAG: hypothetical protein DMD81_17045 [Candidatus Rokuibacteriota bacterium]|nr:MAG: hypothetical protein DMD81_17045 [Candidatus Rokubacteria bacterium]
MSGLGVFRQIQEFVEVHKACGKVTGTVEPPTAEGYTVCVTCACGEELSQWVSPESARFDIIFSTLLCSPN